MSHGRAVTGEAAGTTAGPGGRLYQYPSDKQAWAQDQEFMVGPDLLAAPVTASRAGADGEADQPTPVSVYLPAGRWIDLYSGQVVQGGRTLINDAGLDSFPSG